jgi:hypothetical protein
LVIDILINLRLHCNAIARKRTGILRLKRDGTRAETRFGQFSRLLAVEECRSAVVMVAMLDRPCSEAECTSIGYPFHTLVSPSLPLPCVTVCHQVSSELYFVMSSSLE